MLSSYRRTRSEGPGQFRMVPLPMAPVSNSAEVLQCPMARYPTAIRKQCGCGAATLFQNRLSQVGKILEYFWMNSLRLWIARLLSAANTLSGYRVIVARFVLSSARTTDLRAVRNARAFVASVCSQSSTVLLSQRVDGDARIWVAVCWPSDADREKEHHTAESKPTTTSTHEML